MSGLIPARRLASSSVNPMATASAILATTSGVRLVGRPSPSLSRLLIPRSVLWLDFANYCWSPATKLARERTFGEMVERQPPDKTG